MPPVTVVTDSVACLPKEMAGQYGIEIIPINILIGDKIYKDWVDITPSEAYEKFLQDPEVFKSSAPSPQDCLDVLRRVSRRGRDILCITLSSKLSGTYSSIMEAKEMAATQLPDTTIEVIDSGLATTAEGMVALAAARAAAEGNDLAAVINAAMQVKEKVNCCLLLDTIKHVYRSGRIPKVASQVGSMLNIRPILTVRGMVHFAGAVRNRQNGLDRLIDMMHSKTGEKPVRVSVMHAYAPEEAEKLRQRIEAEFNCTEMWLGEFSPVMGYACGTGTVGAAFYTED